jgi:hypothetical protein
MQTYSHAFFNLKKSFLIFGSMEEGVQERMLFAMETIAKNENKKTKNVIKSKISFAHNFSTTLQDGVGSGFLS